MIKESVPAKKIAAPNRKMILFGASLLHMGEFGRLQSQDAFILLLETV